MSEKKLKNIIKKITYLNVDSRNRELYPKNIVKSNLVVLPNNPISVSKNSNLIKINYPNHNFSLGDNLLIQNINGIKKNLHSPIYLIDNFDYFLIKLDNHQINSSYLKYQENFKINITFISEILESDNIIQNIPINLLLGIKDLHLCNTISTLPDTLIKSLDVTTDELNENYFLVKLPYKSKMLTKKYYWKDPEELTLDDDWPHYPNNKKIYLINKLYTDDSIDNTIEKLNNGDIEWDKPFAMIISGIDDKAYWLVGEEIVNIFNISKIIEINFMNIGNIPLQYLNANYPINNNQFNGFQKIIKVEENFIYFNSKIKAYKNEESGGSNVNVSLVLESLTGYPSTNLYTVKLNNNFVNISKIELVGITIPYIDNLIINSGPNKNNLIYWKQLKDGDKVYCAEIPEGTYSESSLRNIMLEKMNSIERVSSTLKNPLYNLFDIKFKTSELEFVIRSYQEYFLPKSISAEKIKIDSESFYSLTIKHKNNNLKVDDIITITGSLDIGVIPSKYINKEHKIYSINQKTNSYTILINYLNELNTDVGGNGGNDIKIRTESYVSFLFDRPGTIGNILGFKNVGQKNSITEYSSITYNCCNYVNCLKIDSVGNINIKNNFLRMNYFKNDYFLMILNDFETINNNSLVPNCFAKIHIDSDLCKNFDSNPYTSPIKTLNELNVTFINPDGSLTDFRNIENSFLLKIEEQIAVNSDTGINSKNLTYEYLEKIIDV